MSFEFFMSKSKNFWSLIFHFLFQIFYLFHSVQSSSQYSQLLTAYWNCIRSTALTYIVFDRSRCRSVDEEDREQHERRSSFIGPWHPEEILRTLLTSRTTSRLPLLKYLVHLATRRK